MVTKRIFCDTIYVNTRNLTYRSCVKTKKQKGLTIMKAFRKMTSLVLCVAMVLTMCVTVMTVSVTAAASSVVTGADSVLSENFVIGGVDTGITYTQMKLTPATNSNPTRNGR